MNPNKNIHTRKDEFGNAIAIVEDPDKEQATKDVASKIDREARKEKSSKSATKGEETKAAEQPAKKEKGKNESQRPLLPLDETNFLTVLKDLGGKNVTSGQLWRYFVAANTRPQQRFPPMIRFARKLAEAKPPKVKIVVNKEKKRTQYLISQA